MNCDRLLKTIADHRETLAAQISGCYADMPWRQMIGVGNFSVPAYRNCTPR